MSVTPTQTPVSTSVPTLTLAAGTSGGVNVASSIDAVNDFTLIYTASQTATQGINRQTYLGITGSPVGTTDTQTLTNKVLTSPTMTSPTITGTIAGTYILGGTPTFPSSVVQLTGTQTITGSKTFTNANLTSPIITNANFTADAIVGYTTSNSGTVYGVSFTNGAISGANLTSGTVGATALATNAVQANQLAANAITLGYAQVTATAYSNATTSATYVTGLGVEVTIPAGGRNVKVTVYMPQLLTSAAPKNSFVTIWSGTAVGTLTTQLQEYVAFNGSTATGNGPGATVIWVSPSPPSAGIAYFNAAIAADGSSTTTLGTVSPTAPMFILVELI